MTLRSDTRDPHARHLAARVRLSAVAAAVGVLMVLGSGTAWAAWMASDSAASTARAATVGVTSSMTAGALDVTYAASTTGKAAAVTITNTSSRAGTYSLAVSAATGSTLFRSAVAVAIGTTATCTPTATLASPTTGTLAATTTATGPIAAGASITLCVRTTMTSAGIAANGSASLTGAVSAGVQVGTWTATAAASMSFAQSVVAAAAPVGSGWYFLWSSLNPAYCLEAKDWGTSVQQAACTDNGPGTAYNELWKFTEVSGGYFRIASRIDEATRWYVTTATAGAQLLRGSDTSDRASWSIVPVGSGYVQITSRANPALCVAIQGASSASGALAVLAECDAGSASQRFSTDLLEVVVPPPVALVCTSDGFNVRFDWDALSGYQGYVVYRVKVGATISTVHGGATGWDHEARFTSPSTRNAFGVGTHPVTVEQSVMDGPWTVTGTGTLIINPGTPPLGCG